MAINKLVTVQQMIISRLSGFDQNKLSSGGTLEFLRNYIHAIDNATTDEEKTEALQTLRNEIRAVDETNLTLSEIRNLTDIFRASDIGDIYSVKINGVKSKSIDQVIGVGVTLVSGVNNLVDAFNTIGDISKIRLDGSTPASSLVETIGTAKLIANIKTSLVAAINSANEKPENIVTSNGDKTSPTATFHTCSNASTKNVSIAIATYRDNAIDHPATSKIDILNGWIKCVRYSQETERWYQNIPDGCIDITSEGDALAQCLGSITNVISYS